MVRIKHRYLVANILFPSSSTTSSSSAPASLQIRHPTPSHVTIPLLLVQIRSQISALFGDYGIGVTSSSLKMIYFSPATSSFIIRLSTRTLSARVGGADLHGEIAWVEEGEDGMSCVIRVVRVSGTIKKAEEDVVRRARREIVLARMALEGKEGDLLESVLGSAMKEDHSSDRVDSVQGIEDEDEDADDEDIEDESD